MLSKIKILSAMLMLVMLAPLRAQNHTPIGFVYWDVGQLYDTIPSQFYNDKDYTPKGRKGWGTLRYRRKVENIVAVLDSLRMPLVALCGVESEAVVRDIVISSKCDYCSVHRTIDGRDGLDFALLYYGDMLFVDNVQTFYGRIYIEGELRGRRIGIWLTRSGYYLKSVSPPRRNAEVEVTIAAGRMSAKDVETLGLEDLMARYESAGRGNYYSYNKWYLRDRIAVNSGVSVHKSGVYITPWLLTTEGIPKPTYSYRGYVGGYSNYLPEYFYFEL